MFRSGRALRVIHKRLSREFCHTSRLAKISKHSVSFIPTSSYLDHESNERRLKDYDAAVPSQPTRDPAKQIYKNMVRPQDVCDLLWNPRPEDYLVTSLAKECSLLGDPSYKIVSKSSVGDTNLMFASIAISWLKEFESQTFSLSTLGGIEEELSFHKPSRKLSCVFTEEHMASYESFESFGMWSLEIGHSIETVVQFLLTRKEMSSKYNYVLKFSEENMHALNPVSVTDFAKVLINDIYERRTLEKNASTRELKEFDQFFRGALMSEYPDLLSMLNATTLHKLAQISLFTGEYATAMMALTKMVQHHKTAPSQELWEKFVRIYEEHTVALKRSKAQILHDLHALKPILFHHKLWLQIFQFLLSRVVENTHDLAHLVNLTRISSPHLLAECGTTIINKFQKLSESSEVSYITKKVHATQLTQTLKSSGFVFASK